MSYTSDNDVPAHNFTKILHLDPCYHQNWQKSKRLFLVSRPNHLTLQKNSINLLTDKLWQSHQLLSRDNKQLQVTFATV